MKLNFPSGVAQFFHSTGALFARGNDAILETELDIEEFLKAGFTMAEEVVERTGAEIVAAFGGNAASVSSNKQVKKTAVGDAPPTVIGDKSQSVPMAAMGAEAQPSVEPEVAQAAVDSVAQVIQSAAPDAPVDVAAATEAVPTTPGGNDGTN